MSNVKPGDIARCIFDDGHSPSNEGRQCLVLPDRPGAHEVEAVRMCERDHGQMWRVQTLEPWYAHRVFRDDRRVQEMPGALLWVADSRLKRIDPPAEESTDETLLRLPAPRETEPA